LSERATPSAAAAPAPTGPVLQLVGIGSDNTEQGTVHTAVIADGYTVHLVKVGQSVMGYTVVAIAEDAVTLADAAGTQRVLRFR
jgi:hypothetical protein